MRTFTSYDGTRLAYHERGDGPGLVCVPGGPGRASVYLGDLGGLSAQRKLILLDNRGTGDSDAPADPETYQCRRLADDVEALRAHLGLDRMDVLAHSAGASIASLYASRFPQRISRMVLVAPSWRTTDIEFSDDDWLASIKRRANEPWYEEAYAALMRMEDGTATPADPRMAAPFSYGRWTDATREFVESDPAQRAAAATAGYGGAGAFGDPAETRAALAGLTAPVLLLGGDLDAGPTVDVLRHLREWFPNGELVMQPESGHFPWLDDPTRFAATVDSFLNRA
jgi:proline iminopeptidase